MFPVGGPSLLTEVDLSTLSLLQQPYALSQTGLLDEAQFRREAKRRGVHIYREELEELHRRGVLTPLYRVVHFSRERVPVVTAKEHDPRVTWPVYHAAAAGRLQDPAATPFRRWPIRWDGTGVYYSRFQLLTLRALPHIFSSMRYRTNGGRDLARLEPLRARARASFAATRTLAVALEALAPRYLPRVLHTHRNPSDRYNEFVADRDPATERAFLNVDPNLVLRQAEYLLADARFFDPLGEWHRVTRIANRARWDRLAFDALLAQEYRLAAECLLLYVEDEIANGRADPMPELSQTFQMPRHDRVLVTQRERAETIMDFRLSDRPAVVLALEGRTEVETARRVLQYFGHEEFSPLISIVDIDGVGGDVRLLARAVGIPLLDPDGHRGARILAPLSAVVVAADPEGKFATKAERAVLESAMREEIIRSLPPALRTASMRQDLGHLVFVRAWPEEFEFAHFTDTELARAIRSVSADAPPFTELRKAVAACRNNRGPLKSVWAHWKREPSKVAIAAAAWPSLERRLAHPGRRQIPLADVLREVFQIAANTRRAREMAIDSD